MFVTDQENVTVTIYYKKSGKMYVAFGKTQFKENVKSEDEQKKFKTLNVDMKLLTWELFNILQDDATAYDSVGVSHFNYRAYKESKLKKLILRWDATGENAEGKPMPIAADAQHIMQLSPSIAEAILTEYDAVSYIDEEKAGK